MNVIWNGVDFDRFASIKKKHFENINSVNFSFFGYFGPHKGIATLLESLTYLKNRNLIRVNLVGDGEEKQSYHEQLNKNGCSQLVKFWGKLDNKQVQEVYAETDVLVLPSIWQENQPVSITEAMAAGIPVLASRIGGIPEIVEDGKTGLIFDSGNSQDLADKMDFLINHPEVRKTYGEAAKDKMRNNSFKNQVGKLLALYQSKPPADHKDNRKPVLILCIGDHFDYKCSEALKLIHHYSDLDPLITMAEWVTEQQCKQALLIWVVDTNASISDIRKFFRFEIPFLVPEENESLTYICRTGKLGLYYRDEHEAAACISYFLRASI